MATVTYTPLANITLSSPALSVSFTSISQSYKDLVLVVNTTGATAEAPYMQMQFNSDSGSNYLGPAAIASSGSGSTISSWASNSSDSKINFTYFNPNSTSLNLFIANIMDYSATDKYKTILARQNITVGAAVENMTARYSSTSAISSLTVYSWGTVAYNAGSTFALYGIAG